MWLARLIEVEGPARCFDGYMQLLTSARTTLTGELFLPHTHDEPCVEVEGFFSRGDKRVQSAGILVIGGDSDYQSIPQPEVSLLSRSLWSHVIVV